MESKLKSYKNAVEGFSFLVNYDLKSLEKKLDSRIIDGIEHGMVRKFSYLIELCWKLIKKFLIRVDGIDAKTPKQSIKELYLADYIDEENYLTLNRMIDDRNSLSHIYREEEFRKILKKFPHYAEVFKQVESVIEARIAREDGSSSLFRQESKK